MDSSRPKLLTAFAVILTLCALSIGIIDDQTDATSYSLKVGESVTVSTGYTGSVTDDGELTYYGTSSAISVSISSNWKNATVTGKSVGTSSITFTYLDYASGLEQGSFSSHSFTVSAATTPVTSVSISGFTSGEVGSAITLTATTSPTSATDRHVTWSITSGSARAYISSTSDTTTGGRAVILLTSAGSVTVKATATDGSGIYNTKTITITNPSYTCYLFYNVNGGSGAPSTQSYTGTSTSNHSFAISTAEPTRSGYTFLGWATTSGATAASYQPGGTISVGYNSSKTLYAVWQRNVIEINTVQGDVTLVAGQQLSIPIETNVSCRISVTGASWLTVSGMVVSGFAPTDPGTYDVTITANQTGYQSDSISFTVTVVSALGFTGDPTNGVIVYALA